MFPHPGDVLLIDQAASVQFAGQSRLVLRVISVSERPTCQGWCWVSGYVLDDSGAAVDRREVFVRMEGLRHYEPRTARRRNECPR
jgi:hypothetical protein